METAIQTSTQEVLNHHISAFVDGNIEEIMKDYDENSELLSPNGTFKGLNGVRSFFEEVFKLFPKGSEFKMDQYIVRDELIYITWKAESSVVDVPFGSDTFLFKDDKISLQTVAVHVVPK